MDVPSVTALIAPALSGDVGDQAWDTVYILPLRDDPFPIAEQFRARKTLVLALLLLKGYDPKQA